MYVIFNGINRVVLLFGFIFGVSIAIIFFKTEEDFARTHSGIVTLIRATLKSHNFYFDLFPKRNLTRTVLDNDEVSYGNLSSSILREDKFLYDEIHITCIIFVRNPKKAQAVQKTYGNIKHCNSVLYFGTFEDNVVPIVVQKSKSTWHHLCQSIRYLWESLEDKVEWAFFIHDELFAIPENLRYYLAEMGYNYNDTYYLGNPMSFWGQKYNSGKSGYVLSRGTLVAFHSLFNSTDESSGRSCSTGFNWRNEDFYLGKYLAEIGIVATDTRDSLGRGRFHGYGLDRLLMKGGISILDNYRKKGVYKVQDGFACCSNGTITFRAADPGEMYLFSYLVYKVRVFSHGGNRGNRPYPISQEEAWLRFLENLNLGHISLSPEVYEDMMIQKPDDRPEQQEEYHAAL